MIRIMSPLVPRVGANDCPIKVVYESDYIDEADDAVADEKNVVGSLAFIALLKRRVGDTVDSDCNEDMRSP